MYQLNKKQFQDLGVLPAVYFMEDLFVGYKTKDGHPYSDHCITVANFALNLAEESNLKDKDFLKNLAMIALFHDVVEDLPTSQIEKAKKFFYNFLGPADCFVLIENYLTYKPDHQTRTQYINNIVTCIDVKVRMVKQADLLHNSLISRVKPNETVERSLVRIEKYLKEYQAISSGIKL